MLRIILFLLVTLSLISSCNKSYSDYMLGGLVLKKNFVEEIPFDFSRGLPVVKVEINGNEYDFLFDTGAPIVLSEELARKLNFKEVASSKISDSQGVRRKQISVLIDTMTLGQVDFAEMAAIVMDYNKVFEIGCFEFDGILGTNLMSKLKWQIDYDNELIKFSDQRTSFDISEKAFRIPFTEKWSQRKPVVKVKCDRYTNKEVTFDTGASGAFSLVTGRAQNYIDSISQLTLQGSLSVGAYGNGGASLFRFAWIDTLIFGDIELVDQFVEFEDKGAATLGNKFLKGYRVFIDWETKEILLEERMKYNSKTLKSYGFVPEFGGGKISVVAVVKGSEAESLGLLPGTEILRLGDFKSEQLNEDTECDMYFEWKGEERDELTVIFLRDELEVEATLTYKNYAIKEGT